MPVIFQKDAPIFSWPGLSVRGLAAPSRGATGSSVWRLSLEAGAQGTEHTVDREEIFVVLSGCALARLGGEEVELGAGDTLIVPAGQPFSLSNSGGEACEALALAPVGVRARIGAGEPFAPPWTE